MQQGLGERIYLRVSGLRPLLEDRFQKNLRRSLLLTAELGRILDALPAALVFKGPALAQRLFGDIAAREYCDLDLILRAADIPAAISALEQLGFGAVLPLESWQLRAQLHSGCEYVMSDGRIHVELHWQVAPRQFGAPFDIERLFARATRVRIADRNVPTLSPEDDLLALVVHGTKHAWSKLSWIADVAALLEDSDLDWDAVLSEAYRMGIRRMLRIGSALAEWLGGGLPPDIRNYLEADPQARAAAQEVRTAIMNGLDLESMQTSRHRFILASRDSLPDRLAYLGRNLFTPTLDDWRYVALPRGARWLYPAVRLFRLAAKKS